MEGDRLGIDVGGTKILYGLLDSECNVKARMRTQMPKDVTPEQLTDKIDTEARSFLQENGVDPSQLRGIGIGMPSYVDLALIEFRTTRPEIYSGNVFPAWKCWWIMTPTWQLWQNIEWAQAAEVGTWFTPRLVLESEADSSSMVNCSGEVTAVLVSQVICWSHREKA